MIFLDILSTSLVIKESFVTMANYDNKKNIRLLKEKISETRLL